MRQLFSLSETKIFSQSDFLTDKAQSAAMRSS